MVDLTDIYGVFHSKTVDLLFCFFSNAHRTFSRIDHILSHRLSLGKFKKIEIIPSFVFDHNVMRLDISYREKKKKQKNKKHQNCTKHKHTEAKQYASK